MIFITVGSQKFQFNRLLIEIDRLVEEGTITEEVFAQIGYSDYAPQHYSYVQFLDRETFAEKVDASTTIITHGGTGVIVGALKKGKSVIAVPRFAKFEEHVDDHQVQLLEQFSENGMIQMCEDEREIAGALERLENNEIVLQAYESNTGAIIESIKGFIEGI